MTTFRHVAKGSYPGEAWSFTLHTSGTIALTAAQAAWNSAIGSFWTGQLDALVHTAVSLTEVSTASLDPGTGKQVSRLADDVSLPGVATTGLMPPQVTAVASLRTATATRAGRGRFYMPPFDKGTVVATTGRLSGASVTAAVAAVNAMMTSLIADSLTPVIYHRTTFTTTNVTQFDVGDVFDTQRRRRDKLVEARTSQTI